MEQHHIKALLNDILKSMFFKVLRLQEKSVSLTSDDTISRTEMHALEEIKNGSKITLTKLAEKLGISKATASVCVSRLVKKDYIHKVKFKKDKRKRGIQLTERGEHLCIKHEAFHERMIDSLLTDFKVSEYPELLKGLQALYDFFEKLDKELG